MNIPIIADTTHALVKAFGCYKKDEGIAYRGLYIIDGKGMRNNLKNVKKKFFSEKQIENFKHWDHNCVH